MFRPWLKKLVGGGQPMSVESIVPAANVTCEARRPEPEPARNGFAAEHHAIPESMQFTLEPMMGRIAVERMEPEAKSKGGIILPDVAKKTNCRVRVISVCPDWIEDGILRTSRFQPGDILILSRYSGEEIALDGGLMKVVLVQEKEVLARIALKDTADHIPQLTTIPKDLPAVTIEVEGMDTPQTYDTIPA